ncbi:zinc finger BED domain-containing protein RICESLEEPER 2 [Tanacetum coccineum]|uniref:Zinc finger BED domain-containing protein RICESLEEPER 2 n=1 Tax=Tanacetum coccineum TaxID=301880 RepID=A0ABQ4YQ05_9ASTR
MLPTNAKIYDDIGDLEDHITRFTGMGNQGEWPMPVWCWMFHHDGKTRAWFDKFPLSSINNWGDLQEKFLNRFEVVKGLIIFFEGAGFLFRLPSSTTTRKVTVKFVNSNDSSKKIGATEFLIESISTDLEFFDDSYATKAKKWFTDSFEDFVTHLQTTEFETFDVLGFWKAKETMFLVLSRMAMDILSVQATSVAFESPFSTSRRVLSIRRTRLTLASLEMCMCLKDHLDAQKHKQDKSTLETPVDFEEEILDVEVQANEAIPLSDEEIVLDAASSEGAMSGPSSGGEEAEAEANYGYDVYPLSKQGKEDQELCFVLPKPFKDLAEEVQELSKGLEKVEQEVTALDNDGAKFAGFQKGFFNTAKVEVETLISLYTEVGRNGESISQYFGEDPVRCPFEQGNKKEGVDVDSKKDLRNMIRDTSVSIEKRDAGS